MMCRFLQTVRSSNAYVITEIVFEYLVLTMCSIMFYSFPVVFETYNRTFRCQFCYKVIAIRSCFVRTLHGCYHYMAQFHYIVVMHVR